MVAQDIILHVYSAETPSSVTFRVSLPVTNYDLTSIIVYIYRCADPSIAKGATIYFHRLSSCTPTGVADSTSNQAANSDPRNTFPPVGLTVKRLVGHKNRRVYHNQSQKHVTPIDRRYACRTRRVGPITYDKVTLTIRLTTARYIILTLTSRRHYK